MRVVFARNPPDAFAACPTFPTLAPTVSCSFPGFCVEVLKMIADAMRRDIETIVTPTIVGGLDWGTHQDNGTWTGVLGYLQNNTADTACLMYQKTEMRSRYFEFSYPVLNVQPVYVVRERKETLGSVLWNAFKPFSYQVWLVFLGSLILNFLVMLLITRCEFKLRFRDVFKPYQIAWQVVQLQLDEKSDDMQFFTVSGNIVLFIFALLQSGLMIDLYKGILLTALITSNGNDPFRNADEMIKLIASGKYHLTTNYLGNWYFDDLEHSNQSHFVKLRAATAANPVVAAASVMEALDLVDTGKYIYPIQQDSLAMQMSKERCDYVYVNEGLPQVSAYFVFAKNSTLIREFNHQIIMQQSFIQRTFNKYFLEGFKLGDIPKCSLDDDEIAKANKPLDLESTIGVFTIGGIGLALALAAFVLEIYHYWHLKIVERRARMRDPYNVRNLAKIAQIHFTTHKQYNDIDVLKLIEVLENKREAAEI
ncbi:unnamed protein product [Caenorhabditis bovis]|uniref:Ionotropic glutamate receptor L-glutamate and glycine-binding domain-containing protein n=1 Tax=Caenorhabditis bovis TaxID=2654633 RepID=A0A8S1EZ30_9PELO|nr:unnamed protein product [Caenorhabditis bovis]